MNPIAIKRLWLRRTVMVLVSPHVLYFYLKHGLISMCRDWKHAWNFEHPTEETIDHE